MHDRIATPKPLVDDIPQLTDSGRDLRIDDVPIELLDDPLCYPRVLGAATAARAMTA